VVTAAAEASRIPCSRPRLRTDSGDTAPLSRTASAAPRGWGAVPGLGRRAEKAQRSRSASAPGSALATRFGGAPGGNRRRDPSGACVGLDSRTGAGGAAASCRVCPSGLATPGWCGVQVDLGGEQSPWKDRVSGRWQRRIDTTDSSAEQGPVVGRSRRLEGSARVTSVIRAPRGVSAASVAGRLALALSGAGGMPDSPGSAGRNARWDSTVTRVPTRSAPEGRSLFAGGWFASRRRASVTWGSASADRSFTVLEAVACASEPLRRPRGSRFAGTGKVVAASVAVDSWTAQVTARGQQAAVMRCWLSARETLRRV